MCRVACCLGSCICSCCCEKQVIHQYFTIERQYFSENPTCASACRSRGIPQTREDQLHQGRLPLSTNASTDVLGVPGGGRERTKECAVAAKQAGGSGSAGSGAMINAPLSADDQRFTFAFSVSLLLVALRNNHTHVVSYPKRSSLIARLRRLAGPELKTTILFFPQGSA